MKKITFIFTCFAIAFMTLTVAKADIEYGESNSAYLAGAIAEAPNCNSNTGYYYAKIKVTVSNYAARARIISMGDVITVASVTGKGSQTRTYSGSRYFAHGHDARSSVVYRR